MYTISLKFCEFLYVSCVFLGLDALKIAAKELVYKPTVAPPICSQEQNSSRSGQAPQTPSSANTFIRFNFPAQSQNPTINPVDPEIDLHRFYTKLDAEIEKFSEILSQELFKRNNPQYPVKTNKSFWLEHKKLMPILAELALILLSIKASSAFIERFFSICGVVADSRRASMEDELIILRCILKANIERLKKLNQTGC